MTATQIAPGTARTWLERWDRQQEHYVPDREERFTVMGDVLAATVGRDDPLVLDLGCGPGSTAVRVLDRLPSAEVVAVDADPLLLGLAASAYGDRAGLRFVTADLRDGGWPGALGLERPVDAVVSTTALHWLAADELGEVFATCAGLLRPGGVLVDGDHLHDAPHRPRLDAVARAVAEARTERVRRGSVPEDWQQWWDAVGDAPELASLIGERGARPIEHGPETVPSVDDYAAMLRTAGFAEVGTVWQHGDDRVLVGIR